jgi:hypothetical protein
MAIVGWGGVAGAATTTDESRVVCQYAIVQRVSLIWIQPEQQSIAVKCTPLKNAPI